MEDDIIALLVNFNLAHPNCCHPLFASASASYTIGDDNCSNETFTFVITQYMIDSYCYYYWKKCWSVQEPITQLKIAHLHYSASSNSDLMIGRNAGHSN